VRRYLKAQAKVAAKAQGKRKFRFKNKLVSIDSTVIDLRLSAIRLDCRPFTNHGNLSQE